MVTLSPHSMLTKIWDAIYMYRQTSNIRFTLVGNKIGDHLDVVGASPVGTAPTTSSFSTWHPASMDWAKATATWNENHLIIDIWCLTLSRNAWIRFSRLSVSACILCLPMEAMSCVSCSSSWHSAALRSAPDNVWLICSSSSVRHSAGKRNSTNNEGILPKGPYLPCVNMAGRALLAGYHRY